MKNFNRYKYHLALLMPVLVLFFLNYQPGTYLSGWDNLQTDIYPWLGVKRAFFSVWQEYQSFGLVAGMAHTADLMRVLFLWIISFVLPQNIIRYFFHFLMLFLGGLGMLGLLGGGMTAFLGALFYMLNLGTVQIFYLPFEPFSVFFAFLPWAVWIFYKLINSNQAKEWKHNLILFFIVNFVGTPSFYTQQLFVVYIAVLGCLIIDLLLKKSFHRFKKAIIGVLLIIIVNSFWILSQLYYLKTSNNWLAQAKINQISTQSTFYQNMAKGTLNNFLKLKGFYFDLLGANGSRLFAPWQNHLSGFFGGFVYIFIGVFIVGLIGEIKKKNYFFFLLFLICALALMSAAAPFSWINVLLRRSSFINQIFRSPFTKFIVPYSLVYSYFVAKGTYIIRSDLKKHVLFLFVGIIILYSLPSFHGFFISPEMKVKIPADYFQVIDYFKNEDKNQRIALLPDYTYWGWFLNKWGYNGSGFLWYGIEQPIISRTFDVWSPVSEGYFWEEKQAIEAENLSRFESILGKYDVGYLLIDYSLKPVASTYKSLQYDRINNLLAQSKKVVLVFKGENIALFKVNRSQKTENFISVSTNLPNIGPQIKPTSEDTAFYENGAYKTNKNQPFDLYYPFWDLATQTKNPEKKWQISESDKYFSVSTESDINYFDNDLILPAFSEASIFDETINKNYKLNLRKNYDGKKITVHFEKELIKSFDINNTNINNNELGFTAGYLPQKYGYLVKVKTKNIKGSPFFFYVADETKNQSVVEAMLDQKEEFFIIPPKFDYGLGYSFVFQNKSYENYPSENLLEELSIYLFPDRELKQAKFVSNNYLVDDRLIDNESFRAEKINYFTYKVNVRDYVSNKKETTIVLNQAYDPGWAAFADGRILEHVLVNNWSNGWIIKGNNVTIYLVFWPQYLQFIGFGLLIVSFLFINKLYTNS